MKKLITIILIAFVFGCYGQIDPAERHRILVESNKESSEYLIDTSVLCNAGLKNLGLGWETSNTTETPPISFSFRKDTAAYLSLYIENDSLKYKGNATISESAKILFDALDECWYSKIDSLKAKLEEIRKILDK